MTAADRAAVEAFTMAASHVRALHEAGQPIDVDVWCDMIREHVDSLAPVCPRCGQPRPELLRCSGEPADHCEPCARDCPACVADFQAHVVAEDLRAER